MTFFMENFICPRQYIKAESLILTSKRNMDPPNLNFSNFQLVDLILAYFIGKIGINIGSLKTSFFEKLFR